MTFLSHNSFFGDGFEADAVAVSLFDDIGEPNEACVKLFWRAGEPKLKAGFDGELNVVFAGDPNFLGMAPVFDGDDFGEFVLDPCCE